MKNVHIGLFIMPICFFVLVHFNALQQRQIAFFESYNFLFHLVEISFLELQV